ncbi:hypothetical protein AHAS_Ahas12G0035900 [Arachis hypogaea]
MRQFGYVQPPPGVPRDIPVDQHCIVIRRVQLHDWTVLHGLWIVEWANRRQSRLRDLHPLSTWDFLPTAECNILPYRVLCLSHNSEMARNIKTQNLVAKITDTPIKPKGTQIQKIYSPKSPIRGVITYLNKTYESKQSPENKGSSLIQKSPGCLSEKPHVLYLKTTKSAWVRTRGPQHGNNFHIYNT